jgi:hypothetical protein
VFKKVKECIEPALNLISLYYEDYGTRQKEIEED